MLEYFIIILILGFLFIEFCPLNKYDVQENLDNPIPSTIPVPVKPVVTPTITTPIITDDEKKKIDDIIYQLDYPTLNNPNNINGDDLIASQNLVTGKRAYEALLANVHKTKDVNEHIVRPELDYFENINWWDRTTENDFKNYDY